MEEESPEEQMPFWEHLEELRWRILKWVIFVAAAFVVAFVFQKELMWVVTEPHRRAHRFSTETTERERDYAALIEQAAQKCKEKEPELSEALLVIKEELKRRDPSKLTFLKYQEAFLSYLKVCLIAALLVSLPFGLYQMWRFISEGLYPSERRAVGRFLPFSVLLFAAGLLFGYFLLIPWGLHFLLRYADPATVTPSITLGFYLSFFNTIMLALGVLFQLPLVMLMLAYAGIMTTDTFRRMRPYFVVGAFVAAAVFTPPDVVTQIMLALPLLLLFEAGIILSKTLAGSKR